MPACWLGVTRGGSFTTCDMTCFRADEHVHDWASVVCYASLPDDHELGSQIRSLGFRAAKTGIGAAKRAAFAYLKWAKQSSPTPEALGKRVTDLDSAIGKAADTLPTIGSYAVEGQGVLASSARSRAELYWGAANLTSDDKAAGAAADNVA